MTILMVMVPVRRRQSNNIMFRQSSLETVEAEAPCFVWDQYSTSTPPAFTTVTFLAQDHNLTWTLSHYTHAGLPNLANPLYLLNKPLTRDLPPLSPATSNSHRRMFIRHIEWVLQQPYIRRLQRLKSLVHPHTSAFLSPQTTNPPPTHTTFSL